jgi:hypothetical protein
MHNQPSRATTLSPSRRGASQLATQIIVILLMVGTFAGFFGFLYYVNPPAAAPKERQVLFFMVSHDRTSNDMDEIVGKLIDAGFSFQKIDIQKSPELREKHKVVLVPAYIVLENGKEVGRETGAKTEAQLRTMIEGK